MDIFSDTPPRDDLAARQAGPSYVHGTGARFGSFLLLVSDLCSILPNLDDFYNL